MILAHKPTDGSSDNLSPEDVIRVDEAVRTMLTFYYDGITDAFLTYEEATSQDEELKVAIWAKLNSKVRSAIKFKIDSMKGASNEN